MGIVVETFSKSPGTTLPIPQYLPSTAPTAASSGASSQSFTASTASSTHVGVGRFGIGSRLDLVGNAMEFPLRPWTNQNRTRAYRTIPRPRDHLSQRPRDAAVYALAGPSSAKAAGSTAHWLCACVRLQGPVLVAAGEGRGAAEAGTPHASVPPVAANRAHSLLAAGCDSG